MATVSDETKAKAAAAAKAASAAKGGAKPKTKAPAAKSAPKKETPKKAAPKKDKEDDEPAEEPVREEKPAKRDNGAQAEKVTGLRIGAIVLWVLALACEAGAFVMLSKMALNNYQVALTDPIVLLFIAFIVVDAVFCIIAAQLWKKALRIKPCLNNSGFVRTLVHQLGVIMALVCLIPIGIVFLVKSKGMNKKVRTILLIIIAALFVGTTAASVDYKQPSADEVAELQQAQGLTDESTVFWTKWGKSYHFDENCPYYQNSKEENRISGPLGGIDNDGYIIDMGGASAFEQNRFDPCDYCAGGAEAKLAEDAPADSALGEIVDEALEPAA